MKTTAISKKIEIKFLLYTFILVCIIMVNNKILGNVVCFHVNYIVNTITLDFK